MKRKLDEQELSSHKRIKIRHQSIFIDVILDTISLYLPLYDLLSIRCTCKVAYLVVDVLPSIKYLRELRNDLNRWHTQFDKEGVNDILNHVRNAVAAKVRMIELAHDSEKIQKFVNYRYWDYEEYCRDVSERYYGRISVLSTTKGSLCGIILQRLVKTPQVMQCDILMVSGSEESSAMFNAKPNKIYTLCSYDSEHEEDVMILLPEEAAIMKSIHDVDVLNEMISCSIFFPIDSMEQLELEPGNSRSYLSTERDLPEDLLIYLQDIGPQIVNDFTNIARLEELKLFISRYINNRIDTKSVVLDCLQFAKYFDPTTIEHLLDDMLQYIVKYDGSGVCFLSEAGHLHSNFAYKRENTRIQFSFTVDTHIQLNASYERDNNTLNLLREDCSQLQKLMGMESLSTAIFLTVVVGVGLSFDVRHFRTRWDTRCDESESIILDNAMTMLLAELGVEHDTTKLSDDTISDDNMSDILYDTTEEDDYFIKLKAIEAIMSFLTISDWVNCSLVCSQWAYACNSDNLWKPLYVRTYGQRWLDLPFHLDIPMIEKESIFTYKFCYQVKNGYTRNLQPLFPTKKLLTIHTINTVPDIVSQQILRFVWIHNKYWKTIEDVLAGEERVDEGKIWWMSYKDCLTGLIYQEYSFYLGDNLQAAWFAGHEISPLGRFCHDKELINALTSLLYGTTTEH